MGHHRGHQLCCRCVRALRVLSLMCMCVCFHMGSYSHCTHEASRKSVYHPSLATRGQFGSGFDLIMITTAKSSRLLLLHATTLQSATVLYRPTSGHLLQAHIGSPASSHCYLHLVRLGVAPPNLALLSLGVWYLLALLLPSLPCSPRPFT